MSTANRKYKDSVFFDSEFWAKLKNIAFAWSHRHPWRLYGMRTFANRWSRCKEWGKKVPQAYRVYVEDTFLPCDAADARIFAKENFLSLYNALHNTNLQLSCPVENIRLDNVMYMNIINDVSCLVDNKIVVLAEHQSTINENMPNATTVPPCTVVAYEFFF